MSMKVNVDKKKFTRAEGIYLLNRPWLTSTELHQKLQKTFGPDEDEESDDSGDGGDQE